MRGDCPDHPAVIRVEVTATSLAQPGRLFEHRLKHRRQVTRRGIDGLQHLGGRGLPLQRLVALGFALGKRIDKSGQSSLHLARHMITAWARREGAVVARRS